MWEHQSTVDGAKHGQMVLGSIRKQTEKSLQHPSMALASVAVLSSTLYNWELSHLRPSSLKKRL